MKTAVDTNVLLDLLVDEDARAPAARRSLARALETGPVSICPVVYAELGAALPGRQEVTELMHDLQIEVDGFSTDALLCAAMAWAIYARRRGKAVQCPRCGKVTEVICPSCSTQLSWRQRILPDFLVGGHALSQADRILTRDVRFYRSYFGALKVMTPDDLAQ